jgi:myosin-1
MLKLNERATCGVDDFVLLEKFDDEDAFIDNLKIRHQSDLIYVKFKIDDTFE